MVNRVIGNISILLFIILMNSCSSNNSVISIYSGDPGHVQKSVFFSKYRTGISATDIESGISVGISKSECFFGIISSGDASIYKAMKQGNISEVSYVDQEVFKITFINFVSWPIYEEYSTIVVGK